MVRQRGFGLIEVVVAMTLLSVGLLGVAATVTLAGRLVREGQADEAAALEAVQVLDSLAQVPHPAAGQRQAGRTSLAWTVSTDSAGLNTIDLTVRYSNGSSLRTSNFRVLSAPQ